ncbi:MAG TPA: hypothetical protein VKM55_02335 [Candidatus Lokiarchaeia archaeon]|nr:hypothetical protein [Candidatus Lokiarchaeia archaeon]
MHGQRAFLAMIKGNPARQVPLSGGLTRVVLRIALGQYLGIDVPHGMKLAGR